MQPLEQEATQGSEETPMRRFPLPQFRGPQEWEQERGGPPVPVGPEHLKFPRVQRARRELPEQQARQRPVPAEKSHLEQPPPGEQEPPE